MKSIRTTAQFIMLPFLLELLAYLFRPNIYPAYLPFYSKALTIAFGLFYFAAFYLIISIVIGFIFERLSIQPQRVLVPLILGLFIALILARMLPHDSGFTRDRVCAFAVSIITAIACYLVIRKRQFSDQRLLGAISLFTVLVAGSLSRLFQFPLVTPAITYMIVTGIFALLLFLPLRILAVFGAAFIAFRMFGYAVPPPMISNRTMPAYDRVILVGIDGFAPDVAFSLARQGKLPAFSKMMNGGVSGILATLDVTFSPLVWNTIYTGASPAEHGIMSFTFTSVAPAPPFLSLWLDNWSNSDWTHGAVRIFSRAGLIRTQTPALSRDRLEPALWNMADQNGSNAIVIGGWTTYPPERIRGSYVSDFALHQGVADPGSYYPASKDIAAALSQKFDVSQWPSEIQRYVYKDEKAHAVSKELFAHLTPQTKFCTVYFCSVDAFGHHYGTNIEMNHISDTDRDRLKLWREQIYQHIDSYLQDYINMMDDRTLLIVCSDHGFRFDKRQHNYPVDGLLLIYGKGVAAKRTIHETVYSVAPTVTYALGMAPSNIFHVPPIREAFEGRIPELPAKDYSRNDSFYELTNTKEFEQEKLNELQDLQYINR